LKDAAGVGPFEGSAENVVPVLTEFVDRGSEFAHVGEGAVPKGRVRQNAEPNLHLVQPATVSRREDEAHARVFREPSGGSSPVRVLMLSVIMTIGPRL